jgi:hypothetical protein
MGRAYCGFPRRLRRIIDMVDVAHRQAGSPEVRVEVSRRPAVAVTAAWRALPATDRRLLAGRAWCIDLETAMVAADRRWERPLPAR